MKIVGLQKLTLLDYPGNVACTVFLDGCNFRCPFCHNSQLLDSSAPEVISLQQLLDFLRLRKGILDGVCITGGEPTLHPDLPQLLRAIKEMGYKIKLDTNGYRPDVLQQIAGEGLADYVAMDVKNGPEAYGLTVGLKAIDIQRIEQSIRYLAEGTVDYELRCTVVEPLHDQTTMEDMARWLQMLAGGKIKRMYLQSFVDRDTVPVAGLFAPTAEQMGQYCQTLRFCAKKIEVRGI